MVMCYEQGMYQAWGRRGMCVLFWWESQKERDHCKDLDADARRMIILILEKQDGML
jgi:hypothetical protein